MDKNKVNIVNGAVVGVHLGAPMQDATPDKPEDNEAYATERNTETRLANSNTEETLEKQPEPVGGGLTELPEGYPYKEGVSIEWDGNTEGREHTAAMGMEFYWVSPEILTDEEIKNGKVVSNDGNVEEIAKYWDQFVSGGNVTEDATLTSSVAVVRKANAEVAGVVFSTPGVYFMRMNLGGMVGFISKFSSETIHTMAPEFLPAGVGGGVQVVTLTASGSGALDTSSHTGAEIREMAKKGTVIAEIKATGMDGFAVFDGSLIAPDYGMDYVAFHTIMMNENMFSVSYFFIESDSTTVTQKSVKQST